VEKVVLVILCLVIGCILGGVLTMAYLGHNMAQAMFMLQEKEIFEMGEAAKDAYYNQPNEVAVWALENYIKILNELKEERSPAKVKNPYIILDPDTDLVFTHARLGKLYEQMGNAEKSEYNFKQAISCSKNTCFKCISTEEDCLKILDGLDKARNK
jgi:tetratricopeptide (TPR) repeat protein